MHPFLFALIALFLYMCGAFIISLIRRDNGTADIAYGGGFVLVAWISYVLGTHPAHGMLVSILATLWAARLSIRIYLRNTGKPEDFRYRTWRQQWEGTFVVRSFLQVYMLQGALIFIIALPLTLVNLYGGIIIPGSIPDMFAFAGLLIWLQGFIFEAVGDWQLARFMKNPANKGKIMDQGLWRYTRHPNYYGEASMWWGIALIAASALSLQGSVLLTLTPFIGAGTITFLLLKVSGVPLLEARFAGNPAWEVYKRKTSVCIPWFSKR